VPPVEEAEPTGGAEDACHDHDKHPLHINRKRVHTQPACLRSTGIRFPSGSVSRMLARITRVKPRRSVRATRPKSSLACSKMEGAWMAGMSWAVEELKKLRQEDEQYLQTLLKERGEVLERQDVLLQEAEQKWQVLEAGIAKAKQAVPDATTGPSDTLLV